MAFNNITCKICGTQYHWCSTCDISDPRNKPYYSGYCSWDCYKKSDEYDEGED